MPWGRQGSLALLRLLRPSTFFFPSLQLALLLTFLSSGNVNDEGVDGSLPKPRDGVGRYRGKGEVNGGQVG